MFNFRLLTSVAVSLALVSSTIAVPSEGLNVATRALSFNPAGALDLAPLNDIVVPSKRMTNAQRLARGLAPNPPRRRAPGQLRARQSATPTSDSASSSTPTPASSTPVSSDTPSSSPASSAASSSAPPSSSDSVTPSSSSPTSSTPSATPTPDCTTYNGYLQARYSSPTGQYTDGYVSNTMNTFGEYGFTHTASSALAITFDICTSDGGNPVSLLATNVATSYPYIAAITGFANTGDKDTLAAGSYNYAYIGGTGSDIPYGVDPQPQANSFSTASGTSNDVETANWIIDPTTGAVTAQWYNVDGTAPATTLVYVPGSAAFAIVGDLNVFGNNFGTAYSATFTFVTSLPTAV